MKEQDLRRALDALREASAGIGAPEHIEGKLRRTFRSRHRASRLWLVSAIAASLMLSAMVRLWEPTPVIAPPAPVVASMPPPPLSFTKTQPKRMARRVPRRPTVPSNQEVATEFFPIPYAPVLTQMDRGQLIRVLVPASSMRSFGLPVNEERMFRRVQADVLLGEDGIARAVRFVR